METRKQSGYRVICKDLTGKAKDTKDKKAVVKTKTFTVYIDPEKSISFNKFVEEMRKKAEEL